MQARTNLNIPSEKIAEFCKKNHIRKLSLFGSALREDFRFDSDVDVLVEFERGTTVGMIRLGGWRLNWVRYSEGRWISTRLGF